MGFVGDAVLLVKCGVAFNLGAVREIKKSDSWLRHVRLSVLSTVSNEQLDSHRTDFP